MFYVNKIIVDLCGGTGAWSKKYKEAGYIVINVTLPFYDVLKTVIKCDYIIFQGGNKGILPVSIYEVYGILAAPVCTMFSFARTRAKTPRDFAKGMELVIACLNIIWKCRYKNKLAFWCLENPMGYLRQFLGKPAFTFDPCDFGDLYTKKTDLWGYFNIPLKDPGKTAMKYWEKYERLPSISDFTGSKQKARRAITPQGFAKAFYEANR